MGNEINQMRLADALEKLREARRLLSISIGRYVAATGRPLDPIDLEQVMATYAMLQRLLEAKHG